MTAASAQQEVPQPAVSHQDTPFVETRRLWKRFGGVVALRDGAGRAWRPGSGRHRHRQER